MMMMIYCLYMGRYDDDDMMIMMDRFEQYLWPSAGSGKKTSVLLPLIKTFGLFYFIAGVYQLINIVLVLLNPQVSSFDILWFW